MTINSNKNSNIHEYIYSKITIFKYFRSYILINGKENGEARENEF